MRACAVDAELAADDFGERPGQRLRPRVVEPYLSDERVRYVATGSNLGGAGNSTSLLRGARAAYIAVLHDDDLWAPDFLERRIAFLQGNPSCGLVFSCCDFIDDHGAVVHRFAPRLREGIQPRRAFLRTLYRRNVICIPTVLVARWCYEEVGTAFDETVLFYDYEMWIRIAGRFDVGFLNVFDASYRIHRAQTTHAVDRHFGEHRLALLDAVDPALPKDFPPLDRRRARSGALLVSRSRSSNAATGTPSLRDSVAPRECIRLDCSIRSSRPSSSAR